MLVKLWKGSCQRANDLRKAIQSAETSRMKSSELGKLKGIALALEKSAPTAKSSADAARLQALAEILKQPAR